MKTNIKLKPGQKEIEFIFNYNPNVLSDETPELKEGKVTIAEPGWDEVTEAYKWITDENGKLDLITSGKIILDLCMLEIDDELQKNHRAMLSVCSQIAIRFVMPISTEVKKN